MVLKNQNYLRRDICLQNITEKRENSDVFPLNPTPKNQEQQVEVCELAWYNKT